ncbi:MAG: hypothetical protein R6U89_03850 [Dehalococcoidia bacterium]
MLLTNRMLGFWNILYMTLPLETGKTYKVEALLPDDLNTAELTIEVNGELEEVEYGGTNHQSFVCHVPEINATHHVFLNGELFWIEQPLASNEIRLVEEPAR